MKSAHTIPLHIGDLIEKTYDLTPAEFGAYMRLILKHYGMPDGLPDDNDRLRRMTGMDNKSWSRSRETVLSFFEHDSAAQKYRHARVQDVLSRMTAVRAQNSDKSLKRWNSKQATASDRDCPGNATAMQSIILNPESNSSVANATSPPTPKKAPKVSLAELSVEYIRDWLTEKRVQGKYLLHDEHFVLDQFKNYCQAKGKRYADYVAGYRNAFEWDRCQPYARTAQAARASHSGEPPKSKWDIEAERIAAKWIAEEAQRHGEASAPQGTGHSEQAPEAVRADRG